MIQICTMCGHIDCFGTCAVDQAQSEVDREEAHVAAEMRETEKDIRSLGLEMSALDG